MKKMVFVAAVFATSACFSASDYAAHYADQTLGHVGCDRREITASDWQSSVSDGTQTWKAHCRGHEYYCTTGGEGLVRDTPNITTCTEAAPMLPVAN